MSTKEEIKEKARLLRETGQVTLRWPALVQLAEYVIRLLLACMLAGAEIFGGYAPFALGLVGASGTGLEGFAALVGSCVGYLAFRGFVGALPYVAACILTFSVSFAFYDVKVCKQSWFMPAVAALLRGVTGFVYLSGELTGAEQWVFFITELFLVAAAAYFYRIALSVWKGSEADAELTGRQLVCLFILGCTVLMALAQVRLGERLSLGCAAAAVICMVCAWKGGAGAGAAVGVCTGLSMDLALGQAPWYTMAYGFAALLTGVFWKQGKLFAALTFVLANGTLVLWALDSSPELNILYEVFVASVVFMVLPDTLLRRAAALLSREEPARAVMDERIRRYGRERLESTAHAFRELYDSLRTSFRRVAPNNGDCSGIFHRAANKVCVLCALRDRCWQREYPATMNALNDALPLMVKRGKGEAEDFPLHFRTRCLNFPLLLATANEELTALRYRRQFQSRAREGRENICRQYGLFARALDDVVRQMEFEPVRDPAKEKRVRQRLSALGIHGVCAVWYDRAGHLQLEVSGQELDPLKDEEERIRLSRLMGMSLTPPEESERNGAAVLCWRQAEPLMAVAGVAARKKEGQTVSGDAGAWFKTEEGGLFVLLCDGMGSGPEAHRESTAAIALLEKFLCAGMEPEEALNTLNSALALRCEEEGGFTTIDLFRLDLYTGEAGFYKLGAAPSYVRRKGAVTRVTGTALPAGLAVGDSTGADVSKLRLESGDSVVLISDGVASPEEDGWVKTALAEYDGTDPKALATALMDGSAQRQGATDDRTAVVLTVKER